MGENKDFQNGAEKSVVYCETCENNIVLAAAKTNTLKNPLNCLISNREGLGKSLEIMGIATIDPHSQKEHSEIHKIPKLRVNQASFDWDTAIKKRQN